jgi:hypothetical protein
VLAEAVRRASPLGGRMLFVLAPAQGGGELVARVLGALPGVARCPAPTHLFDQGLATLHANHAIGTERDGFSRLLDEDTFHALTRRLGDDILVSALGAADLLVEHTPDHIGFLPTITTLYPDARLVHVVRDPRNHVGDRNPLRAIRAARTWAAAHRGALSGAASAMPVRLEDLVADPAGTVRTLAVSLGIDPSTAAIERAVATARPEPVSPAPRARVGAAAVEAVGADILDRFGYPPPATPAPVRRAIALLR